MTLLLAPAFTRQRVCVEFAALKHACPRGIYIAPVPGDALLWAGVLFLRSGPYANAVLKFQIDFPDSYPTRLPVLSFQTDVFHPLVTPLTTYTYSTRSPALETISAGDDQRLPPGGVALHHGFPDAYGARVDEDREKLRESASRSLAPDDGKLESEEHTPQSRQAQHATPHVVEILHYLRIIFEVEDVIDSIPIEAAVNAGAWHAWRSYRIKTAGPKLPSTGSNNADSREVGTDRSTSPRQKSGGARRPGEWNWQGVWEDRVRKCIQASSSDAVLFGGESNDLIGFVKLEQDVLDQIIPTRDTAESIA